MKSSLRYLVTVYLFVALQTGWPVSVGAQVTIEYIGHACFVLESPTGTRLVVDPFSSTRWLGYQFPSDVQTDAVLVTHPHYDHDASYYWGDSVPVFREPGDYSVSDVRITGITGRHADPYGKDFEQKNTLWLVEAGGLRILHVGDNGPLTQANFDAIGRIDILMVPADGDDHILKPEAISAMEKALRPEVVIPMHYRLAGFLDLPASLGPVEPWLKTRANTKRLETNRHTVSSSRGDSPVTLVFAPSPALKVWPAALAKGWEQLGEARELAEEATPESKERAASLVKRASENLSAIPFAYQWARVMADAKHYTEAAVFLEAALAKNQMDDWEYRNRSHLLLGILYDKLGKPVEASAQFRIVVRQSYRTELLELAREFLNSTPAPHH